MIDLNILNTSIFDVTADVIVNPANASLMGGSGLCGEIFRRTNSLELEEECTDILSRKGEKYLPAGQTILTKSHGLNFKAIAHTVTPRMFIDDISLLKDCYLSCLELSEEAGYSSIVFPTLGTGINNIPIEQSAKSIIEALSNIQLNNLKVVNIAIPDHENYIVFEIS